MKTAAATVVLAATFSGCRTSSSASIEPLDDTEVITLLQDPITEATSVSASESGASLTSAEVRWDGENVELIGVSTTGGASPDTVAPGIDSIHVITRLVDGEIYTTDAVLPIDTADTPQQWNHTTGDTQAYVKTLRERVSSLKASGIQVLQTTLSKRGILLDRYSVQDRSCNRSKCTYHLESRTREPGITVTAESYNGRQRLVGISIPDAGVEVSVGYQPVQIVAPENAVDAMLDLPPEP